jgi:hypothetical protein
LYEREGDSEDLKVEWLLSVLFPRIGDGD